MITDGTNSYAVFTYRCGDMNWAYSPTIGFNAAGSSFANHPNTGSSSAEEIACLNSPDSQWYNVVYQISLPNATNQTSLPTIESRKMLNMYTLLKLSFVMSAMQTYTAKVISNFPKRMKYSLSTVYHNAMA